MILISFILINLFWIYNLQKMFKYIILSLLLLSVLQAEKDYTDDVKALKAAIEDKNGPHYHFAYNKLAFLSDTYGPRMWGSAPLEKVIN